MTYIFYATPDTACVSHATDAPVVAIKFQERGYYPIYTRRTADELNATPGWTADEITSAVAASMFGWNCPAARAAIDAVARREAAAISNN